MRTFTTGGNYVDAPLQSSKSQIRLLRLNPGQRNDDGDSLVEVSLFRTDLVDAPPYEALSYHWGRSPTTKTIKLDGTQVEVRENLENALQHLKLQNEPRILWVDGLCINQQDVIERNAQVSIMHEIYKKSVRTVAWIGDGRDDGELALEFLQWYAGRKALMQDQTAPGSQTQYQSEGWEAVRKLLLRPYWRRLWVMQEIALSSAPPLIVCGRSQLVRNNLVLALEQDKTAKYIHRLQSVRGATYKLMSYKGENTSTRIGRHVILLLSHSAGFETTEPRDRVYALYGLFKVVGIVGFTPDYSIPVGQVFQQLTEYALSMKGGLDALELRPHDQDSDLPSWVVDFSKRPPLSYERRGSIPWRRPEEIGERRTSPTVLPDNSNLLKVYGVAIDEVSAIAPIHPCLINAFRSASETMGTNVFGGHSLRSDSIEASKYWASQDVPEHPNELCYNAIHYLHQWQSIISYFYGTRTRADSWVPRSWDWQQMVREAPPCTNVVTDDNGSHGISLQMHQLLYDKYDFETRYRKALDPVLSSLSTMLQGRTCFSTANGFHGVTLASVSAGDKVVVLQSTKHLHILRPPTTDLDRYSYIGAAVLCASHDKADGQQRLKSIFDEIRDGHIQDEQFILR